MDEQKQKSKQAPEGADADLAGCFAVRIFTRTPFFLSPSSFSFVCCTCLLDPTQASLTHILPHSLSLIICTSKKASKRHRGRKTCEQSHENYRKAFDEVPPRSNQSHTERARETCRREEKEKKKEKEDEQHTGADR
mmetsp:Transcript_18779/g.37959  ORF Transcript_18779/g.37959 Transcript_18779/m.37959 type:complete len:136 (+) Transcript_18779:245-652(+)